MNEHCMWSLEDHAFCPIREDLCTIHAAIQLEIVQARWL